MRMDAFPGHRKLLGRLLAGLALCLSSSPAIAAPAAPADPEPVRQATYFSPAEFARSNASVQKPNDPMPIGPGGHDSADGSTSRNGHRDTPMTPSAGPAVLSMFGSLAVVIGLFLGLVWLLRRGSPKSVRLLSSEVVELLGRSPLAGRQQMHVVRFGSRLLLVAVSPDGAETLAEITDPSEVDRLSGLCQQTQANSATQAFRQIFGQFAERRRPGRQDSAAASDGQASAPIATGVAAIGSRGPVASRRMEDDDV